MATAINRTSLYVNKSADLNKCPVNDWIHNPTLPGVDKKYWKISGDDVLEMTTAEKTIVDDTETKAVIKSQLSGKDARMVRGIDDLIELLVSKGIISLTDLPSELKDKYNERKVLRSQL
jgi:hypothetical protein